VGNPEHDADMQLLKDAGLSALPAQEQQQEIEAAQ
jgi:hypothetical protein